MCSEVHSIRHVALIMVLLYDAWLYDACCFLNDYIVMLHITISSMLIDLQETLYCCKKLRRLESKKQPWV